MSHSTLRNILIAFVVLVLVVALIVGLGWWKFATLKKDLVDGLEKSIGAQVELGSLELDLTKGELRAAGITLTNVRPSAPWEKGSIGQAIIRFNASDVFSSTMPVQVEVSSWNVVLTPNASPTDSTSPSPAAAPSATTAPASTTSGPGRIRVTQLIARDGSVEIDLSPLRQVMLTGVTFKANESSPGSWTTTLETSSVKSGTLEAGASSVVIHADQGEATLSNLRMSCGGGYIIGDGEAALSGDHEMKIHLTATEVPVTMLVGLEWQMKLAGLVSGNLAYSGNDLEGSASGVITLHHAKFNVLPWLGKVTTLVNLPDVSDVEVDKATSDFTWKNGQLEFSNLDIRKTDVLRITGTADLGASGAGQIDGKLKLGLPSTVIAKWPQLQEKVFSVQFEEYNWTDVHLTGPADHLQEDLSPRLFAVSVQQGGSLLDQAKQKAAELYQNFMGK